MQKFNMSTYHINNTRILYNFDYNKTNANLLDNFAHISILFYFNQKKMDIFIIFKIFVYSFFPLCIYIFYLKSLFFLKKCCRNHFPEFTILS